jgi:putative lipoprotein
MRQLSVLALCFSLLVSCSFRQQKVNEGIGETGFKYARNIIMEHKDGYVVVKLLNPWKKGTILQTYYLMPRNVESENISDGVRVDVPIQRSVVFTSAHANLLEMLHAEKAISGVADLKYMLIPDIRRRAHRKGGIVNCGDAMKPDVEQIIDLKPEAILLSPFENGGGYGRLEEIGIPVIECADYMEESALGRAEWMKFYGLLFGREREADSLFAVVEKNYQALSRRASQSKVTRSVLPDRKVGPVWYLPGGESSVGLLYKDAHGVYAYAKDKHSGSLSMPFETVLDKFVQSDFWILSYRGDFSRAKLLAEFQGYSMLKPCRTGEIYGCKVDSIPYFEEVSWRPDWLLSDLIQLFHPDLQIAPMRYYHKLK